MIKITHLAGRPFAPSSRPAVVFDLDGTLSDASHRRHLVMPPMIDCPACAGIPDPLALEDACPECNDSGYVRAYPPRWDEFYDACDEDAPVAPVITALHGHIALGHDIWIVSGRSDAVFDKTLAWIKQHVLSFCPNNDRVAPSVCLIMRPNGDYTPDVELKRSWLDNGILPADRILCTYDDRNSVVAMWRDAGLVCLQVAQGDF